MPSIRLRHVLTYAALLSVGCPPVLDWNKMEAEEGEITLIRQERTELVQSVVVYH